MPYEQNITKHDEFFQGVDIDFDGVVYDPTATKATIADGSAPRQNISGWALSLLFKRQRGDADDDALLQLTTGAGEIVIVDGPQGEWTAAIADDDTDDWAQEEIFYELKRTDSTEECILTYGKCFVRRALHRT